MQNHQIKMHVLITTSHGDEQSTRRAIAIRDRRQSESCHNILRYPSKGDVAMRENKIYISIEY